MVTLTNYLSLWLSFFQTVTCAHWYLPFSRPCFWLSFKNSVTSWFLWVCLSHKQSRAWLLRAVLGKHRGRKRRREWVCQTHFLLVQMFISDSGGSGVVPFHFLVSGTCELYKASRILLYHTHRFPDGEKETLFRKPWFEQSRIHSSPRPPTTLLMGFEWSLEQDNGEQRGGQSWWEHPLLASKEYS